MWGSSNERASFPLVRSGSSDTGGREETFRKWCVFRINLVWMFAAAGGSHAGQPAGRLRRHCPLHTRHSAVGCVVCMSLDGWPHTCPHTTCRHLCSCNLTAFYLYKFIEKLNHAHKNWTTLSDVGLRSVECEVSVLGKWYKWVNCAVVIVGRRHKLLLVGVSERLRLDEKLSRLSVWVEISDARLRELLICTLGGVFSVGGGNLACPRQLGQTVSTVSVCLVHETG